jgi:predicted membrane-bound mannosyltransferase
MKQIKAIFGHIVDFPKFLVEDRFGKQLAAGYVAIAASGIVVIYLSRFMNVVL